MFKTGNVDVLFRLLCLIVFSIVILLAKNVITLIILLMFLFLGTFDTKNILFVSFYLLNIVAFIVCFSINNYLPFRLVLIISYIFYFMLITNLNMSEENKRKKGFDYKDIRFKKSMEKEMVKEANLDATIYVTMHFVMLFISLIVGVI